MAKRKKKPVKSVTKRERGTARTLSKYNIIQSALSSYGRERSMKWGKGEFSQACSKIYASTKGIDAKAVGQNIEALYKEYVEVQVKVFPADFAWWLFLDELRVPIFDGVMVSITFDDGFQKFDFKGLPDQVEAFWQDHCYKYFRTHYNESPPAYFEIIGTDNKSFVDYKIVAGVRSADGDVKKSPTTHEPSKSGVTTETEALLRLEQEKQRTMDKVLELVKAGFTKEEIFRIIGK